MTDTRYKYLDRIDSPDDLKKLGVDELPAYCAELRQFIVGQLATNPGHLGASLGAVELAAALHYAYDTPHDKLVWDVGHQAYPHKIITGRKGRFATNRKLHGISGFPRMAESEYDAFGGGHASVSISAALGMAIAGELRGEPRRAVAVIGDGSMTGGLAFEGLNNAGATAADLLVVLNDNNMSIDQSVGAMKGALLKMRLSRRYNKFKRQAWSALESVPALRRFVQRSSSALRHSLLQENNIFENLGFRYFGPVDGHDVAQLVRIFEHLREIPGPKLLHVVTVKGKGYAPAESDQSVWHAPGTFDPDTGERDGGSVSTVAADKCNSQPPLYQDVFGHTLLELARRDSRIVGITPAMPTGCSLNIMMEQMPERTFDVGIAEGHAVTFAAGMAAAGMMPFCNIYSSFMQRAYDNVIHDVALQRLGVVFCLDRAGLVGEDGATHHGAFDIAYFRPIPDVVIASPLNEAELRALMFTASQAERPFVIRYPRGRGEGVAWDGELGAVEIGRGRILREGEDVAVLSFGPLGNAAARAAECAAERGVSVFHADLRFAKPLDAELLHDVGRRFRHVVTIEDGVVTGGIGSGVQEFFTAHGYDIRVVRLGLPDAFIEHGTQSELRALCGLDEEGILKTILDAGK
ncbi:MAG: 1-deoxy-D-xylulose-5-phosphate synthase [Rikenellaceae bacterium]|nr:1-deoxy-D-xylulose-5-phosphate synthase [Rikenellaceae bacterium]MCL2692944.1 1-deoxy-D-xylulose-5-phosphate synthase [Rikenellaceae bacterium]